MCMIEQMKCVFNDIHERKMKSLMSIGCFAQSLLVIRTDMRMADIWRARLDGGLLF